MLILRHKIKNTFTEVYQILMQYEWCMDKTLPDKSPPMRNGMRGPSREPYTYLYLFKFVLYSIVAFNVN